MTIELKSEIQWIENVLQLHRKIYQSEHCTQEIKNLIRLELMRILGKEYDVKKFLEKEI